MPAATPYGAGGAITTGAQAFTGTGRIVGFSARETTSSGAAQVVIRSGTDATGVPCATIDLAAGQSSTDPLNAPDGLATQTGFFVDRISGTTEVSVWVAPGR